MLQRHDPAAWARTKLVLQKRHVSLRDMQAAICMVKVLEPPQPDAPARTAAEVLPDCPAPWMRVPTGFSLDANGTYEAKATTLLVAHAPIVIAARFRDVETGTEALRIHWRRPDGWRERTVDRAVALDARRIIELAAEGFPVSSNNVAGLTKYLADAEALNWSAMPTALVSSHLGWQGRYGEHGFLAGRTLVAARASRSRHHALSMYRAVRSRQAPSPSAASPPATNRSWTPGMREAVWTNGCGP